MTSWGLWSATARQMGSGAKQNQSANVRRLCRDTFELLQLCIQFSSGLLLPVVRFHHSSTTVLCTVAFAENCGPLSSIENGYLTYTNGTIRGSLASYNCQRGYILSAPTTRECGFDGEWSVGTANCTRGRLLTVVQSDL